MSSPWLWTWRTESLVESLAIDIVGNMVLLLHTINSVKALTGLTGIEVEKVSFG